MTKLKARAWVEERQRVLLNAGEHGQQVVAVKAVPTLKEFGPTYVKDWLKAEKKKPRTISEYERILKTDLYPTFGDLRLDEIRLSNVQAFKSECVDEELESKTVNNSLTVLSQALKFAARTGVIDVMPCAVSLYKVPIPEVVPYDAEEYALLRATARDLDPRSYVLVLLGGDAGLRRGEMVALEWDDLEFRRNQLHVRRSESKGMVSLPKGGKTRVVPMTVELRTALEAHRDRRDKQQRRVLARDPAYRWDRHQEVVRDRTLQSWMERVQTHAKMPVDGKLHKLRHTFCSRLAERGALILEIKELAGHADIKTTLRYMHLAPNKTASAIALLDGENQSNSGAKEEGPRRTPLVSAS